MKLAIKGHPTRGKEVIEILKMLGGRKEKNLGGSELFCWYYINENGNIDYKHYSLFDNTEVFTLEEFLEKFPYKVGDKVQYKGATSCGSIFEVEEMRWEENTVKYTLCLFGCNYKCSTLSVEYLQPYKEETMEEKDIIKPTTEINLNHPCFDEHNEIELIIPNGWKFKQRGNKMFGIRTQYPKTYEECCKVLGIGDRENGYCGYEWELLGAFQKLYICRDAYWKIAGDWKPDWAKADERKYCIVNTEKWVLKTTHQILAFPTEEMRDAFYENFNELIVNCKELL